jgi:DnaA family protein
VNAQLPLAFKALSDQRCIDFLCQESVRTAVEQAAELNSEHALFLAGAAGSGKSHLLQAAVNHAGALGSQTAYVPLAKLQGMLPQVLEGFEMHDLVCLDDVQAIAGYRPDEEALFHFYNRAKARGARLIFAGQQMPENLGIGLPDLVSRLQQGLRLNLSVLDEQGKRLVLQRRASRRGLQMDDAVTDYLFTRVSRDLHTLSELLDRLDHASLAAQRRLTVPFIKTVLAA